MAQRDFSEGIDRRSLLLTSTSAAALMLTPGLGRAQADPLTLYEIGTIAFSVVSALWSAVSGAKVEASLADINGKLDTVIANQQRILNEIAALKLYIDQAIWNGFRQNAEFDLGALKNRYDRVIKEGWRQFGKTRVIALADDIETKTFKAAQYDFSAYFYFMAGVGMSLTLKALVGTPINQIADYRFAYRQNLLNWLDPANTKTGLPAAMAANDALIASKKASTLPPPPGPWGYEDTVYPGSVGGEECTIHDGWRVYGSFESGYSAQRERLRVTGCSIREPHGHPMWADAIDGDGAARGSCDILPPAPPNPSPPLPIDPDYSGIPSPNAPPSQFDLVNQMNANRREIIALMKHGRDLIAYGTMIRRAADALA